MNFLDTPASFTRTSRVHQSRADYANPFIGHQPGSRDYSAAWYGVMTVIALATVVVIAFGG